MAQGPALGPLATLALAFLAIERHRPVRREELAEILWDEVLPPTWEPSLRSIVSRVRRWLDASGLGTQTITASNGCYRLHLPADVVVDVEEAATKRIAAEHALASGDWDAARSLAQAAGDVAERGFLPGASGLWVERRQGELEDLGVRLSEIVSEAASASGDHRVAISAAEAAIARRPLRESAHLRAIAALQQAGNRPEALRAYERCRVVLAEELGVSPGPATQALYLDLLREDPPAAEARSTNIGAELSSFVGRSGQVDEVKKVLSTTRLLTLVGPGGMGKTRLATRVGSELRDRYRDGAWLVELAPLVDPALVPSHVMVALGLVADSDVTATDALCRHLAERELLIVLDNCEHLTAACATLVRRLLLAAPGVTALATSREPIGVPGESLWPVPGLSMPAGEDDGVDRLWESDAVQLFVDRASSVDPTFTLSDDVAPAVAEICRRLDGLPLAIELAAARARSMSVPEIATHLRDRFRLLVGRDSTAPVRHQSLRAAVDWSHDALRTAEQVLFRRLSVFTGGFTLESAAQVCVDRGPSLEVVDGVPALVDRSLVLVDTSTTPARYRLLETLRQYGAERLRACGEEELFRTRHLNWCVSLVEAADVELCGPDARRWLATLDVEHDNIQGALAWAVVRPHPDAGLRLASAMRRYWEMRWRVREGRDWFERLFSVAVAVNPVTRASALADAGILAMCNDDADDATRLAAESVALAETLGRDKVTAQAWAAAGGAAIIRYDPTAARAAYCKSREAAERAGDRLATASAVVNIGFSALLQGKVAEARPFLEQGLVLVRELGNPAYIGRALIFLGGAAHQEGRLDDAHRLLVQAISTLRDIGDHRGLVMALLHQSEVQRARGDVRRGGCLNLEVAALQAQISSRGAGAALLHAAEETLRAGDGEMGGFLLGAAQRLLMTRTPRDQREEVERTLKILRCEYKNTTVEKAFNDALSMSTDAAVLYATTHLVSTEPG